MDKSPKKRIPWNKGIKTGKLAWNSGKKQPYSEETLRKMSLAAKKSVNLGRFVKGHKFSEQTLKKISKSQKKRFSDPCQIKIISEAHLGSIPWNKGKTGVYSQETIKLIREFRARQKFPKKDSSIEVKVQNFLRRMNMEFHTHCYMGEIEYPYLVDILIPELNLIIECDGDYWHGNPKFYSEEELTLRQRKQKERDFVRTKQLLEKGYKVLRLWGSEIRKMDFINFYRKIKEIVNSRNF